MPFSELERKRIEKSIGRLMERRRPPAQIRNEVDVGFRIEDYNVELFMIRPQWDDPKVINEHPFARATYVKKDDSWKVYWMRQDLKWHLYDPRKVATFDEFVSIVVDDDNGCFFG